MNKSIHSLIDSQILDFFLLSNFVFHLLKKHIYIYIYTLRDGYINICHSVDK